MDERTMVGQHLFTGFEGVDIPADFARHIRDSMIGNVILFSRNVKDAEGLFRLCEKLQELVMDATGYKAFIALDQEGGSVSRLPAECAVPPGAMGIAATGRPRNAYAAGLITGTELSALGVNLNLAPVADVNSNRDNPVIGTRSFGDKPDEAACYAVEMMRGLMAGGVLACAKHFPGHGDTAVDSHLGLPLVEKTLNELRETELLPFLALIRAGVPAVMSSHILFPQLDGGRMPATMSGKIMTGLLKEGMGFTGLVLSDCMMMGAVSGHFGTVNGAVAALKAGVDLVLISHDAALAASAAKQAREGLRAGTLCREEMEKSTEKILQYKAGLCLPPAFDPGFVGSRAHRAKVNRMYEESLTGVNLGPVGLPPLGPNPLFIGCASFQASQAADPDFGGIPFHLGLKMEMGGEALSMGENPGDEDIAGIIAQAPVHTSLVLCTANAHRNLRQLTLLRALSNLGLPLIVLALHSPYDLADLPDGVSGVAVYTDTAGALSAVIRLLRGEIRALGRLPVKLS